MKREKELFRQSFIDFQREIAELRLEVRTREDSFLQREKELLSGLFEILDGFESLEETIRAKEEGMDKTTRIMAKNIRAIHRKLERIIEANQISRMVFPDNKAGMEYCKIVDTKEDPDLKDATIVTIVKNGYIHDRLGTVLRKAEVITVLNGQ